MATDRETTLAANEVLFRELNGAIRGDGGQAQHDFVCECSDLACQARITLTLGEYRHVRSSPRTFFVLPGHDVADVEDVIERSERYWVVRKHEKVDSVVGAG